MSKKNPNNAEVVDTCVSRLNALKKYVSSSTATIAIDGKAYAVADVIAMYQGCLDERAALKTQRAQVAMTLASRAAAETLRRAADRALKPWVINTYGANSQEAHDFDFLPAKAPTRSAADKAQAVVLNHATREARHTMGSKQKEKVKGTIPVPAAPADPATNGGPVAQAAVVAQPATVSTPVNGVATAAVNGAAAH